MSSNWYRPSVKTPVRSVRESFGHWEQPVIFINDDIQPHSSYMGLFMSYICVYILLHFNGKFKRNLLKMIWDKHWNYATEFTPRCLFTLHTALMLGQLLALKNIYDFTDWNLHFKTEVAEQSFCFLVPQSDTYSSGGIKNWLLN